MPEWNLASHIKTVISLALAVLVVLSGLASPVVPDAPTEYNDGVKNVIFLIGDGMGENHLEMYKQITGKQLYMENIGVRGLSDTSCTGGFTTDSAAGATALACGTRTVNGYVGVYPTDPMKVSGCPISLTELAMDMGKLTGIVTTDSTGGATPAGFSAHTESRNNNEDIAYQQIASGIDLIWGKSAGVIDAATAEENGVRLISTYTEVLSLVPGEKSYGQFETDFWSDDVIQGDCATLDVLTERAIDLLDDDEDGFFLMVEGAHIDKHSHNQNAADMVKALDYFDRAIEVAVEYARENRDTLVVVTADHETGAIRRGSNGVYSYTSGSHSNTKVAIFTCGYAGVLKSGEVVLNEELSRRVAYAMGADSISFPRNAA